jgi:beta-N-acetylhexosaminidase
MRPGFFIQSGLRGVEEGESLKYISKLLPTSIVLFSSDFKTKNELNELIHKLKRIYVIENNVKEPIIAIDQEGGNVVRIPWLDYNPSNLFLGEMNDERFTNYVGRLTGFQLSELGINWNLAPVLDLLNGYNPVILERSFGSDPLLVGDHGSQYIKGLQLYNVRGTAKHFPGHGSVLQDSHLTLPSDNRNYESVINDMFPFKKAIEANVASIMLSHVLYTSMDPDYPASLSLSIQKFLRKDLGYKGIIITDSVDMKAIADRFELKEIIDGSIKNEVDIIEDANLSVAMDIADAIANISVDKLKVKADRILKFMEPTVQPNIHPNADLLRSVEITFPRVKREVIINPDEQIDLILLDSKDESKVSESLNISTDIQSEISRLDLNIIIHYGTEYIDNYSLENKQLIIVGRNEHLHKRIHRINEVGEKNKCVFVSTSFDGDIGIFHESIGYVSAYSKKPSVLIGSILKSIGYLTSTR